MSRFIKYRRTNVAEMRAITVDDLKDYYINGDLIVGTEGGDFVEVSVSREDIINGSPKVGDFIARNPNNHKDQWLVAEQYAKDNFEKVK